MDQMYFDIVQMGVFKLLFELMERVLERVSAAVVFFSVFRRHDHRLRGNQSQRAERGLGEAAYVVDSSSPEGGWSELMEKTKLQSCKEEDGEEAKGTKTRNNPAAKHDESHGTALPVPPPTKFPSGQPCLGYIYPRHCHA